jgi:hypothetical protein
MKLTLFDCFFNPVRITFRRLRKPAAQPVPPKENLVSGMPEARNLWAPSLTTFFQRGEKSVPSSASVKESPNAAPIEQTQAQYAGLSLQTQVQDAEPIEQTQTQDGGPTEEKQLQYAGLNLQTQVRNIVSVQAPLIQEPLIQPQPVPKILTGTLAPFPIQEHDENRLSPGGLSPVTPSSLRRNASSRSISSKGSVDGNSLSAQLRRARIPYHRHAHSYIVPICKQRSLITVENIKQDIQEGDDKIELAEIEDVAAKACNIAPSVFATLAYMKKGHEICALLRDGISDKDLPLKGGNEEGKFTLERASRVPIETFERWDDEEREEFDRIQWWMMAPVFKSKEHHELNERTILPFIPFKENEETEKKKESGYSEVYARRIHPSHHNFWDSEVCKHSSH